MSLKLILLVAIAGALGSTLRYLVNLAFLRGGITGLPFATLTVNVLGCFLAGLFFALFATKFSKYAIYAPVLMVGFLGAFTTFSTFALESVAMLTGGAAWKGLLNIGLQNLAGLGSICAGAGLVRLICRQG
ncbi:CrcB family protein [uncultured Victivallis sp.]|uniref:fluoride efflux transporter FluC n=1 Tax=uncultured Victivallis sp. TaxID=354118 RepID=UPI0025FFDF8E|nr:CrcB family protein [uncultured Victivallis sp.]